MKSNRPYYPAIWLFLAAFATSVPWSWFVSPPAGLSTQQLHIIRPIYSSVFLMGSFATFFGYATGIALFRARPMRRLSASIGAVVGICIVAASKLSIFDSLNFAPLGLGALVVGLLIGIAVGFKERRAG